jgi:GT2 family glycosyltransferase
MPPTRPVTVAIPTLGRERVLVETVEHMCRQEPAAAEILVVDQTPGHEPETEKRLRELADRGEIRWIRLPVPSIPRAMNTAICEARFPVVLFLDDDVIPAPGLIENHWRDYADESVWSVVGQVLQPGQRATDEVHEDYGKALWADLKFPFNSTQPRMVRNCMAGNLSVRRDRAIAIGGFDENFVAVAFRFETEFCRRLWQHGGRTLFEPAAGIRHLRAQAGGTRSYIDLRRTHRPDHSVGDYYFALLHGTPLQATIYTLHRLVRSLTTRYLARHPWWMPAKLLGELRGLFWAFRLAAQGQKLMPPAQPESASQKAGPENMDPHLLSQRASPSHKGNS